MEMTLIKAAVKMFAQLATSPSDLRVARSVHRIRESFIGVEVSA